MTAISNFAVRPVLADSRLMYNHGGITLTGSTNNDLPNNGTRRE